MSWVVLLLCIGQILSLSCNRFNWKVLLWHYSRWRSCKGKGIDIKAKIPATCSARVKAKQPSLIVKCSYCSLFRLSWFFSLTSCCIIFLMASYSRKPHAHNISLRWVFCEAVLSIEGVTRVMCNGRGLVVLPFSDYIWLTSCLTGKEHLQVTVSEKRGLVDLHNCSGLVHFTHFFMYSQLFIIIFQDTYKIVQFLKEYQLWVLLLWIKIKLP